MKGEIRLAFLLVPILIVALMLLLLLLRRTSMLPVKEIDLSHPAPQSQPLEDVDQLRQLTVNGLERSYLLHIPKHLDRTKPAPVILGFHGGQSTPKQFAGITKLSDGADALGYVVAYPTGYMRSWNAGDCCGPAQKQNIDDVGFVKAILDDLRSMVTIDPRRIFAAGWSNGGKFAYRLACEFSDRIAAVAVVGTSLGVKDCRLRRPVPILHFHGTADTIHPFTGGVGPDARVNIAQTSAPDTIQRWLKLNGCLGEPRETYKKGAARCLTYSTCREGAVVTLCIIEGMGHQWPGHTVRFATSKLGPGTEDISATDMLLAFFAEHPMPTTQR